MKLSITTISEFTVHYFCMYTGLSRPRFTISVASESQGDLSDGQPGKLEWGLVETNQVTNLWWCMPLIPAHRRQRQADICEFKDSLVYTVNSRLAGATGKHCLKKTKIKNTIKNGAGEMA